jgi:hypothetical protein
MDDIDGIQNHDGLRYYIVKYLTIFYSLILMGIKI